MALFMWIIPGMWVVFYAILYIPALISGAPLERRSPRFGRHALMIFSVAIVLLLLLGRFGGSLLLIRVVPDTFFAGVAGVVLTALGLGFATWARIHLGRFWSSMVTIRKGHQLIRTGPYRFVRNPLYSGLILALLGAVIAIGELVAFIAFGFFLVAIRVKIRDEEEILREQFGDEYTRYRQQVKSLVPYIL